MTRATVNDAFYRAVIRFGFVVSFWSAFLAIWWWFVR